MRCGCSKETLASEAATECLAAYLIPSWCLADRYIEASIKPARKQHPVILMLDPDCCSGKYN